MTDAAHTALSTLAILAFNLAVALALTGLGLGIRRAFGLRRHAVEDCFQAFWMGFGVTVAFLLVWNFVLPVGASAFVAVFVAGAGAAVLVARSDQFEAARTPGWAVVLTSVFWLWIANLSLAALTNWDSAFYHMQGVKWAHEFPVVPGLANLFGPLGFDNASFLYNAMVGVGPWTSEPWHVSNGLLISVAGAQAILAGARFIHSHDSRDLFGVLLLPFLVDSAMSGGVSSYSTVLPMSLTVLAATLTSVRAMDAGRREDRERAYDLFAAPALAAIAVTLKTSAAVFAAMMLAICLWGLYRMTRDLRVRRRAVVWTTLSVVFVGAAWSARTIVLSGYPLFPSPALAMPVDWRVPFEHARAEFEYVQHSARATTDNIAYLTGVQDGLSSWVRHWGRTALNDVYDVAVPCGLALIASFVLLLSSRRANAGRWMLPSVVPLVPVAAAVIAWWFVAPMPYYAAPFFWVGAAWLSAVAIQRLWRTPVTMRRAAAVCFFLGFSPCLGNPAWAKAFHGSTAGLIESIGAANFKAADSGGWFQSTQTPPPMTEYRTTSGLVLSVPQGRFAKCWNAPGLCTPNPAPNLRLRVPGRVESGFIVDGPWQMIDWPVPASKHLLPAMRRGWDRKTQRALK